MKGKSTSLDPTTILYMSTVTTAYNGQLDIWYRQQRNLAYSTDRIYVTNVETSAGLLSQYLQK